MTSALEVTNIRTAQTLETRIDAESLVPQDSGSREAAEVQFDLWDEALAFDLLPEDEITVSAVGAPSDILFGGLIRMLDTDVTTRGRKYRVTAYDYSTLLDRINVVEDDRPAGESDADRLAYFMTTYGSGLLDDDPSGIATLNASMPAQKFRLVTLRQAIEQVLGTALETGTYRLNAYKKLDTWDSDPGLAAAPFNVVLANPGAGEIAPEAISIKGDSSELYNAYWVRGATAAGSGWFTNAASIAQWGRREKYIDAPDSDLSWKAFNVGMAALADTKQPKYRGTMTLASGDWRSEQRFLLTSAPHGLTAAPFDTARVSRRYLTGAGLEVFDVEFGSPKASFAAKHGKEARRNDGVGPGSGGFGPGGGFGGGGGGVDCGCPDFTDDCPPATFDDMNRTNGSAWGTTSSAAGTYAGSKTADASPGGLSVFADSMVPTHGIMKLTHPSGTWNASGEERIVAPGFWSTGDWRMTTSVEVVNTNVAFWDITIREMIVHWSRSGAELTVGNNGHLTSQAMAAGTFDGMGFIDIELRLEGSTFTAIVAGVQVSSTNPDPVPGGGNDDLIFDLGGLAAVAGGAEVHFGPISIADCVSVPVDGQAFIHEAVGDGSTTAYNAGYAVGHASAVLIDGIDVTSDVTVSGTTYTFGHAPPSGAQIKARLLPIAS